MAVTQVAYAFPLVPVANFISTILVLIPLPWLLQHWNTGAWTHGRKKAQIFDLFFCIGVPILSIALSWFIQGHRFTIIEGAGCVFAYYVTPLYVALYEGWFIVFGALCPIYGMSLHKVFIFRALIRRRNALREVSLVDPDISLEKFRRVIALGCTQCLFTLPCVLYVVIMNVKDGLNPWKGLADAHYNFSAIWQVPLPMLAEGDNRIIQWNGWVTVFVAVVFFLFFGSSIAMWKSYMKGISSFASRLGIALPSKLTRSVSPNDHKGIVAPMVFKIRTVVQTFATQSHSTNTIQFADSETTIHSRDNSESSRKEREQPDMEKGVVTITEVLPDGESRTTRPGDSSEDFLRVNKASDLEDGSSTCSEKQG
ncbi:fungal pheromone STE3G-protein-coupled receptor [Sanghuangporus baumii]|uniref:Fungal pheromone STE3G-protein-coupled receptor n=1 Tax=Sanghuangporus baumii TaxID=108892 RepID=A0A9Q5I1I0_SANBA|nr:fungal pheromone STE3G-protein-coupled receptor [Sanghuangporus baumii]